MRILHSQLSNWCYPLALTLAVLASAATAETKSISRAERAQQAVAAKSDAFAQWIDAFFDDPSVEIEAADSRLRLRQSLTFSEHDSTAYRLRVNAKLKLPNLSKRLSLTFQGNADEDELEDGAADVFEGTEEDALDDPALGLQYFFRRTERYHGSFYVGSRLDNPSMILGPRFRYRHPLGTKWSGRYTQGILWDTDEGWESRTRFDFDRALPHGHLFRQSFRAEWQEDRKDEQGMRYTLRSALVQRLNEDAAISYDVASRYTTKPRNSWVAHNVNVRFRRTFWRNWIFVEAAPFVTFEKKHDWDANPGIRFSIDIIFDNEQRTAVTDASDDDVPQ